MFFREYPTPDQLSGVCIDRACDVAPYVARIGSEGHPACQYLSENLNWFIDPFHVKGHIVSF